MNHDLVKDPESPDLNISSDEGLTLETSASESLYGGQFTLSTQLIKPIISILTPTQHQKLAPFNIIRLFIILEEAKRKLKTHRDRKMNCLLQYLRVGKNENANFSAIAIFRDVARETFEVVTEIFLQGVIKVLVLTFHW